jgi:DNA-binding IclR family transcriptional regulator
MRNATIEIPDELIEERLMLALARNDVLPYQERKTSVAANADDRTVRRVLQEMIERGLVQQQAARKGLWFLGYAKTQAAAQAASLDDAPAPFASLLRELAW